MPRLDGMTFYRELESDRSRDGAQRVLFVTGDVAGTEAERFLEETGCRWLAKPFRLKDLLRVAREMLGDGGSGFRVPGSGSGSGSPAAPSPAIASPNPVARAPIRRPIPLAP